MPRPTSALSLAASLIVAGVLLGGASPGAAQAIAIEGRPGPAVRVRPTGGLRVESAALLMSAQEGGTIPFAALALPFPGEGDRSRVPVIVEIDGSDLLAGQRDPLLRIEVSMYALTRAGSVQGSRMDTVEIDLERLGTAVGESGVRYVGELSLPPDTYEIRVLVRNMATGELGLRSLEVGVPPFKKSLGILLPPAFADPGPDLWVAARPAAASPLAVLTPANPPSARPILTPDEEASVVLAGWRLGGADLRVQIFRRFVQEQVEKQEKVADLPVQVKERRQGPGDLEIFTVTFRPEGLQPGEYELRASIPRSAADLRTEDFSMRTRFVLFPGGAQGSVWAALNSGGRAPQEGQAARRVEPAPDKRRKPSAGPIRKSYREALTRLAAGDAAGAAAAVRALETSLLTGKDRYGSDDVAEIEAEVARDLARKRPEILEPVFMLHLRLYREASEARDYLQVSHARDVSLRLADAYAGLLRTPEGKARTARLLLGMAADLLKSAPPSLRERTYQRILDLDEGNQEALLCRAVDLERQGRYPAAAEALERLLRFHPGHGEARLRLGIQRLRLGKPREGRTLLEELVATPPEQVEEVGAPAVLLARQELVRHLTAQNELAEAERLAREGLERHPEDEKLSLQIALLQDLRRDARGARETLEPLETRSRSADAASPRHRYNALPLERLEAIRDELTTSAAAHSAALATALAGGKAP